MKYRLFIHRKDPPVLEFEFHATWDVNAIDIAKDLTRIHEGIGYILQRKVFWFIYKIIKNTFWSELRNG